MNKGPYYLRSRPAEKALPSAENITTLAFYFLSLIYLKIVPISEKNFGFIALRTFGLDRVTLIIWPLSSSSTTNV